MIQEKRMNDMAQIISGKECSEKVRAEISAEVVEFKEKYGYLPGLTVIIVGQDPASTVYVRNKKKACKLFFIFQALFSRLTSQLMA